MTQAQKPSYLMQMAYRYLDGLPSPLGKAVEAQAAIEREEAGRPRRAAEARRLLPLCASAAEKYCSELPTAVASWVCLLVETFNHMYVGGKKIEASETLPDVQEGALDGLILDYAGEIVAVMETR